MPINEFLVFYIISESNKKKDPTKIAKATKRACLSNFKRAFPNSSIVFCVDNVSDTLLGYLDKHKGPRDSIRAVNGGSHSQTFLAILDMVSELDVSGSTPILIQEDDYLYLPDAEKHMAEALEYSHYVTGYLHPDKFMDPAFGGNPSSYGNAISEPTRVIQTSDHFWMMTNSTTGTFGVKLETLLADMPTWRQFSDGKACLEDYNAFMKLRTKGRTLLMPIPTLSTHVMTQWLSPLIGTPYDTWDSVIGNVINSKELI